MSQPRAHHYCPEFYLREFSDHSNEDKLHIIDLVKVELRNGSPKNQAHQRDFYKTDVKEGCDPFYLEKEFSKIESESKKAIDYIKMHKTLLDEKVLNDLINFMGLQAVRTPTGVNMFTEMKTNFIRDTLKIITSSDDFYNIAISNLPDQLKESATQTTREEMNSFITDSARSKIEIDRTEQLLMMLKGATSIVDCLLPRKWQIIESETGNFVTSDHPVSLVWSYEHSQRSIGWGLMNTSVSMPLTKHFTLCGTFEEISCPYLKADERLTAYLNTLTTGKADRYVYSAMPSLSWLKEDKIANLDSLFEFIKANHVVDK